MFQSELPPIPTLRGRIDQILELLHVLIQGQVEIKKRLDDLEKKHG